MYLAIDAFGEQQFEREILRVRDRALDMRPAFEAIHQSFLGVERRQFSTQGGFSGGWAPLAESTVAAKARRGRDPRILHDTLRLRRSLANPTDPDHVTVIRPDELFMGSKVEYGVFHQRGTRRMPRRRPVELTETQKRRWVRILQRYLVTGEVMS